MKKTINNRAWLLVAPVMIVVLFSALLPMMTVVNYSIQDAMAENQFFWNGDAWFRDLLDPTYRNWQPLLGRSRTKSDLLVRCSR